MTRQIVILALLLHSALGYLIAHAQQPGKVPRIGYLTGASPAPMKPRTDAFRTGLRELGYIEGKNIVIEWRYADQKFDRVGLLANELVQLKVDIIVTGGPAATRVVKELTSTTPTVMTQDSDPVGNGFVASLARPGGNITGLSNLSSDLVGKRLEILKEIVAKLSRVAVIGSSNNPGDKREFRELEHVASAFALKLQYLNVLSAKDLEPAFTAANKARADAVFMNISGPIGLGNRKEIAKLAVKHRLPVIYTLPDYVEAGGLVNYGVNLPDLDRRAATYVDKILKGAKPADLPVEQAMKFDFVINLKAAKQIGLTIPPNVLVRADKVIR